MYDLSSRVLCGAFAALLVYLLVKALIEGKITARGTPYTLKDAPGKFVVTAATHSGVALLLLFIVAGYDPIGYVKALFPH